MMMYELIKQVLPPTFEVTSPRCGCPHRYYIVCGNSSYADAPNKTLHIPGDFNDKGQLNGAGEIRVTHQFLVAPGTDVEYTKDGKHVQGRYTITNDVPLARLEMADFLKAIEPYTTQTEKVSFDEMKSGVGSGKRHAKAMSYAYHLIATLRLGYDLALIELTRFGSLCTPPLADLDYFDRALKAAIRLEAQATHRKDETVEQRAKILYEGQEQRIIETIQKEAEDNLPNYEYFLTYDEEGHAFFKPAIVAQWLKDHRHFKTDYPAEYFISTMEKAGKPMQNRTSKKLSLRS